jgi:hypothetical protein
LEMRLMSAAQFTAIIVVPVPPLVPRKVTIIRRVTSQPMCQRVQAARIAYLQGKSDIRASPAVALL